MSKVLIIYEIIPEKTEFYTIYDPADSTVESLRKIHGKYSNATNNEEEEKYLAAFEEAKNDGMFKQISFEEVVHFKPDLIFHTGFIC